jgi:3'(2'), 5'-bisphosphate nucleotidase
MDSPYTHELNLIFGALQVAAKLSQHIIHSTDKAKGIVSKPDLSPVTVADFAIQALLATTVKAAFPNDTVVGEENASQLRADLYLLEHVYELLRWLAGDAERDSVPDGHAHLPEGTAVPSSREQMCNLIDECGTSVPSASGRTWVFDPIDGTKTYVRGELYAINVALLVDGKQELGIVGCPNMSMDAKAPLTNSDIHTSGCIVFAARGYGAWIRPLPGSSTMAAAAAAATATNNGTQNGRSAEVRRLPRIHSTDSKTLTIADVRFVTCATIVDSALKGINELVAKRVDAPYPGCDLLPWVLRWTGLAMGLGNTTVWVYNNKKRYGKIWDHAGAMLLFEETGGRITDIHGKEMDLLAGRKMTSNCGFIGAPAALHQQVMDIVHELLVEHGNEDYLKAEVENEEW